MKYINAINQSQEELLEGLKNASHLHELTGLFDYNIHRKIIIQCDDLNSGISAVGQIGCCMNGFMNIKIAMETDIIFDDDIFFDDDNEEAQDTSSIENLEDNFVIMYESEFDSDCKVL